MTCKGAILSGSGKEKAKGNCCGSKRWKSLADLLQEEGAQQEEEEAQCSGQRRGEMDRPTAAVMLGPPTPSCHRKKHVLLDRMWT